MIKTRSASNLLDVQTSPAIGAECCQQSLPPLTTEKRGHAEIGDGSPQSPPPPTEKRNRLEQPLESDSFPPTGEEEKFVGKGFDKVPDEERYPKVNGRFVAEDFYEMPVYFQEGYLKSREKFGDRWEKYRMYAPYEADSDDDEPFGDASVLFRGPNDEGYGIKDYPNFKPLLNFRESRELYTELGGLAEKTVAYFNEKNNHKLCFEDIESVALCQFCRDPHYLLTAKAVDPHPLINATSVKFLRGDVTQGQVGYYEAKVNHCELVTLDAF